MTILIPAYEPTLKLLMLILEIQETTNYRILVVDDGSGERYKEIFREAEFLGCTVLRHDVNMGKGAALKTGFLHLLTSSSPDDVVCADSDGQHRVLDIIRVANAINNYKPDMVLGTREFTGRVPLKSKLGNKIASMSMKLATGLDIKDTQTGLRAYPFSMLSWLRSVEGDRFEYELNLLLAAKKSKMTIRQMTIATVYDDNNKGTHFRPVRDSIRVLSPILKFCGSSIISGILDFFLLFLFQNLSGSLLVGVVSARTLSAVFNYTFNRTLVFKARSVSKLQSAPRYFGLVAVMLLFNYALLAFLINMIGMPGVPAKLLTETILFIMSYTVQRVFVFKHRRTEKISRMTFEKERNSNVLLINHMQRP